MSRVGSRVVSSEALRKRVLAGLTIADLSADCQEISGIIGLDATLELMEHLGGDSIYLPRMDGPFKKVRDRMICQECNGTVTREFARQWGMGRRRIRQIIKMQTATADGDAA